MSKTFHSLINVPLPWRCGRGGRCRRSETRRAEPDWFQSKQKARAPRRGAAAAADLARLDPRLGGTLRRHRRGVTVAPLRTFARFRPTAHEPHAAPPPPPPQPITERSASLPEISALRLERRSRSCKTQQSVIVKSDTVKES